MRLADPGPFKKTAEVIKTEEKGSDVNLALHVLNDAWHNRYDCAVICSNDSDLKEAFRLIRTHPFSKKIVLVVPGDPSDRPASATLKHYANAEVRISENDLVACQLPNNVSGITRPKIWK